MKKLRAYTNVLKFRLNRALKREAVSNYPVEAYVEPTTFCNLRCPACPTGLRLGERAAKAIDERLFKAALDEVGDYTASALVRENMRRIRAAKERLALATPRVLLALRHTRSQP